MIKLNKPKRYALFCKIPKDLEHQYPNIVNDMLNTELSISQLRLPKNTLKVSFVRKQMGHMHDDFVLDQKTLMVYYEVTTFRR